MLGDAVRFASAEDIVNRGLQHLGATRISTLSANSKNASEAAFVYDKCRRAELRANPWNFSARRQVLRPYTYGATRFLTPITWAPLSTYTQGSLVLYNGTVWINNLPSLTGTVPGSAGLGWQEFPAPQFFNPYVSGTTYYAGEIVGALPSVNEAFVAPTMTTASPPASPWIALAVIGVNTNIPLYSPVGQTTNTLAAPKAAYPLPSGYLRVMQQDAKNAATPSQLATGGMQSSDFEFEAGFLLSNLTKGGPIVFRFSADLQTVTLFDDLFCEALAARVAVELNETITQSAGKAQMVSSLYEGAISKAVRTNAIEAGSTEPDTSMVDSQRGPTREKMPAPQPRQQ